MVFAKCLLFACECTLIPLQGLLIPALMVEYNSHDFDRLKYGGVVFAKCLLEASQCTLTPLKGLLIPALLAEYIYHLIDRVECEVVIANRLLVAS